MAVSKSDLLDWLDNLPDDAAIGIDEGGLTLVECKPSPRAWFEIGGIPEDLENA